MKKEVGGYDQASGKPTGSLTDHEEGLVAGDHPLQHGDDGRAFLSPRRALDAELFIAALLLVEQVWAKDGGQV